MSIISRDLLVRASMEGARYQVHFVDNGIGVLTTPVILTANRIESLISDASIDKIVLIFNDKSPIHD